MSHLSWKTAASAGALFVATALLVADSAYYDCARHRDFEATYTYTATCGSDLDDRDGPAEGQVVAEGEVHVLLSGAESITNVEATGEVAFEPYGYTWNVDDCEGSSDPDDAKGTGVVEWLAVRADVSAGQDVRTFFCDVVVPGDDTIEGATSVIPDRVECLVVDGTVNDSPECSLVLVKS